jgi:hypothetical protein
MTSDRRQRIQGNVQWLKRQTIDLNEVGPARPFDCLAEHLAYTIERCRTEGYDEAEHVEVLMVALSTNREDLLAAEAELRPLGYTAACSVLRRLARRAPPRPPSWREKFAHRISTPVDRVS